MKDYAQVLPQLHELLSACSPPLSPQQADRFQREAIALGRAFAHLDDLVVIGIAGGTGVGKSTLINALAGKEITRVSPRRPTSDSVIVYQHADVAFASRLPPQVLCLEETRHTSEDLRRVIILDLPDSDSLRIDHRRILAQVLPQTDLLLLTTDPAKYGDRLFYELIASAVQAQENKIIIFNKTDLLDETYGTKGEEVLSNILADLRAKLHGIWTDPEPQIFPLSARAAYEAKLNGGELPLPFLNLERMIFQLREEKLRRRIKSRNLDARYATLKADLRAALLDPRTQEKTTTFSQKVTDIEQDLTAYSESLVSSTFSPALHHHLSRYLVGHLMRTWSVPARLVARLFRLTLTRALPEGAVLTEKLKIFQRRQERAVTRLSKEFARKWDQPFPEAVETPRVTWNLRQQVEALAGEPTSRRFYWVVIAGLVALVFFAGREGLLQILGDLKEGKALLEVLKTGLIASLEAILTVLNPLYLLLWVVVLLVAYAAVVLLVVVRVHVEAEKKLIGLADGLRQELDRATRKSLEPFRQLNRVVRQRVDRILAVLS